MERIIIREVDNTSNVEQLSSYDVVYVPGFSSNQQSENLFRNPTLITTKYQFLNTFGDTVPTFKYVQPYPVASATTKGFPTYAIPYFSYTKVDSDNEIVLSEFSSYDAVTNYFTHVDIVAPEDDPASDWIPSENTNYFLLTENNGTYSLLYSNLPLGEEETYIDIYGEQGSNNVYVSAVNPRELQWFESRDDDYRLTTDTQIGYDNENAPKSYFATSEISSNMFELGDPDPGYRYALYLLSLGIPVYYEVMNMSSAKPLDLISDWQTSLIKYGSSSNGELSISPAENGWWYYKNGDLTKYEDEGEELRYTSADQVDITWYEYADISLDSMYEGLAKRFTTDPSEPDYSFDSMGDYSVKYITSGGYPTFEYGVLTDGVVGSELAMGMIDIANKRQDAIALIDHTNNPERSIYAVDQLSVVSKAREEFGNLSPEMGSYGTMFTPWYSCSHTAITTDQNNNTYTNENMFYMPASLAYLSALAVQLRNNLSPWLAVSGVARGKIPYFGSLHTNQPLTNNVADSYQLIPGDVTTDFAMISINPITYIRQYGHCIWGNRTLRNNRAGTKATSFLNIRNLVSDIKKKLYEASEQLLFEQNTDLLWIDFKHIVTPLLDQMVSSNILTEYNMVRYYIDPESGEPVPAYKVLATITIRPINAVEVFDLTVRLENQEFEYSVSVTE